MRLCVCEKERRQLSSAETKSDAPSRLQAFFDANKDRIEVWSHVGFNVHGDVSDGVER